LLLRGKTYRSHILVILAVLSLAQLGAPVSGRGIASQNGKPFSLPFTAPPGPDTWLFEQFFGNTLDAYSFGKYWYADGQGLHFGIDMEAPCGTPVVAIGDGVVDWIDNGSFGAGPHTVTLLHPQLGFASLYGHLQQKVTLLHGQPVRRGEVIGQTGDPDLTCASRPHLHLEIRSLDYRIALNPIPLIDADWDMLASLNQPDTGGFAKDLNAPNRWQWREDQPEVHFGNRTLNQFGATWPPSARFVAPPQTLPEFIAPPIEGRSAPLRRLTRPDCCSRPWWSADSRSVRYLDGPEGDLAAVMALNVVNGASGLPFPVRLGSAPPVLPSPDGRYEVRHESNRISVVRLADGASWAALSRGAWPRISPGSAHVLWQVRPGDDVPGGTPPLTEIWVAPIDGSDQKLLRVQAGGTVRWLDDDRILITQTAPRTQEAALSIFTLRTGKMEPLASLPFMHALTVAPGGEYLMYLLPFQNNGTGSGIYLLETKPGAAPRKMPFFGGWRWRDSRSVVYIPFEPSKDGPMRLMLYDILAGTSRRLTDPAALPFRIVNSDWAISPDGRYVVFVEAADRAIWLLTLSQAGPDQGRRS
jgi:hypothetical protein